jgi:PIN domain nuclease of toxin-antitoxin system
VILDASAVLAFLLRERGHERVLEALAGDPRMSTVNFAEVATKYVLRGFPEEAERLRDELPVVFVPVDDDLALQAALMASATKPLGLSLGDRICLALAKRTGLPALTADRAWLDVAGTLGVTVEVVR